MYVRAFSCLLAGILFCFSLTGCHRITGQFGAIPPPPMLGDINDPKEYTGVPETPRAKPVDSKSKNVPWDLASYCLRKTVEVEAGTGNEERVLRRNNAAGFLILKIRQSHDLYAARVSEHRVAFDTLSDLTLAASTAVSAINPGPEIGATSVALVAGKASVEKNIYSDLSRTALLIDMYKSTTDKEKNLRTQLQSHTNYSDYPMMMVCNDLDAYLRSVSVIRAVQEAAVTR